MTTDIEALCRGLEQLGAAKLPYYRAGAVGQTMGCESWKIVATGNHLAVLYEAATALREQQAEIERLTKELNARARQIGIACHKHDLTHSLECGACAREARAERDAYKKAIIIHNDCCRRACDERGEYCSPYKDRGMQCPDCHHHDMIEVTAAMAGERT